MIVRVVPVLARFEQGAELDGLIGLVMVHGPPVQGRKTARQRDSQRRQDQAAERGPAHLIGVPNTSTST